MIFVLNIETLNEQNIKRLTKDGLSAEYSL